MKQLILIIVFSIFFLIMLNSQQVKYYNSRGKETSIKKASYKEVTNTDSIGIVTVVKLSLSGDSIFLGNYLSLNPEIREGNFKIFNNNGKLLFDKNYSNNKLNGVTRSYYESGHLKCYRICKNDFSIKCNCYNENGEEMPILDEIIIAMFNNSDQNEFRKYIQENLNYPTSEAIQSNISGKVYVQFTVTKDGKVKDVRVVESVHPMLDREAIRVVKSSTKKWTPGYKYGEPVDLQFTFPVVFIL